MAKGKKEEHCYRIVFEALEQGGDIEKTIKTAAHGLQVPAAVVDPYGEIIADAYTTLLSLDAESCKKERLSWIRMIEDYYVRDFGADETDISPTIVCPQESGVRILDAVIVRGGLEAFCLTLHSSQEEGRFISQLISRALSICFGQKEAVYTVEDSGARQVVSRLLLGKWQGALEYMPRISDDIYEAYAVPPFLLAVIETEEDNLSIRKLRNLLGKKYRNMLAYMEETRLTVLFTQVDSQEKKENICIYLNELVENGGCSCGISELFEKREQIPNKCKIVERIIRIGRKADPEGHTYTEYRYYMELVCSYAYEAIGESSCFHKELELLEREDQEKGTDFYRSLKEYLLAENNVNLAAKNLFIHRNTMVYRLAKIQRLLDLDINNCEIARRLMLSILLRTFI